MSGGKASTAFLTMLVRTCSISTGSMLTSPALSSRSSICAICRRPFRLSRKGAVLRRNVFASTGRHTGSGMRAMEAYSVMNRLMRSMRDSSIDSMEAVSSSPEPALLCSMAPRAEVSPAMVLFTSWEMMRMTFR